MKIIIPSGSRPCRNRCVTDSPRLLSWQLSGTATGLVRHVYLPNAGLNRVRVLSTEELLDLVCPQVKSLTAPSTTAHRHCALRTLPRCCGHNSFTTLQRKSRQGKPDSLPWFSTSSGSWETSPTWRPLASFFTRCCNYTFVFNSPVLNLDRQTNRATRRAVRASRSSHKRSIF